MIKPLEHAEKEYYMTYYKCHCEYCNGDFVASIDDMHESALQFGMPKVANDEYAWKCPTCGHPNTGKNVDLELCYQNGKNNIIFELSDKVTVDEAIEKLVLICPSIVSNYPLLEREYNLDGSRKERKSVKI